MSQVSSGPQGGVESMEEWATGRNEPHEGMVHKGGVAQGSSGPHRGVV